jgi:hypothetical protein
MSSHQVCKAHAAASVKVPLGKSLAAEYVTHETPMIFALEPGRWGRGVRGEGGAFPRYGSFPRRRRRLNLKSASSSLFQLCSVDCVIAAAVLVPVLVHVRFDILYVIHRHATRCSKLQRCSLPDFESAGREFEPLRVHHLTPQNSSR